MTHIHMTRNSHIDFIKLDRGTNRVSLFFYSHRQFSRHYNSRSRQQTFIRFCRRWRDMNRLAPSTERLYLIYLVFTAIWFIWINLLSKLSSYNYLFIVIFNSLQIKIHVIFFQFNAVYYNTLWIKYIKITSRKWMDFPYYQLLRFVSYHLQSRPLLKWTSYHLGVSNLYPHFNEWLLAR